MRNLPRKATSLFLALVQSKQQKLFAVISISGNDPKQIDHYFTPNNLLAQFQRNMKLYDLEDGFNIVSLVLNNGAITANFVQPITSVNLIDLYLSLTPKQVAQSCKWYATFTHDNGMYHNDLSLLFSYFLTNVESKLLRRVIKLSKMVSLKSNKVALCFSSSLFVKSLLPMTPSKLIS